METTIKLRVDREDLERWKREAAAEGRSLSGLIRWRMNGNVERVVSEAPRGDRREKTRTPGRFKAAVDVAHEGIRKLDAVSSAGPTGKVSLETTVVRHTAESNRLTCLCATCVDYRHKNDIPLGGFGEKKKR